MGREVSVCVACAGYEWELTGRYDRAVPATRDGPGDRAHYDISEVYIRGMDRGENLCEYLSYTFTDWLEDEALKQLTDEEVDLDDET